MAWNPKIPWHNTYECNSKQPLLVELKGSKYYCRLDSNSKLDKEILIIDMEPSVTIATINIQWKELDELKQQLFHLQTWLNGIPLHFATDNYNYKNLSQHWFSRGWSYWQHYTPNESPLLGWARAKTSTWVSNVPCNTI